MKKAALWITRAALFITPVLSLYVSSWSYFPFITGKNFLFRILVEIAFSAWILLAALDAGYRPKFSWVLVLFTAFTAWLFVADLFAVNAHKALWSNFERMDGWVTLIHLFIFFLVAGTVLHAEKLWRAWWLTFIGAAAWVSIHGLFQLAGSAAIHQSADRLDASLGNAEYLAGYLLFALAVTIWQAIESKATWLRYGLFVLAVVELVVLIQTQTRGTIVGLVGGIAAGLLFWALEAGKRQRKYAVGGLIALVVLVGGFYTIRTSVIVTESPLLSRFASIYNVKEALGVRFTLWNMAAEGIKERPVLGWGQEGYNYIFNKYYDPSLYAQEPWFDRAHNVYLDWTVAGGVPALVLFLLLLMAAAVAVYRHSATRAERILLLSALVAYAVQGLVVFDNLFTYLPLAAILGIAHGRSARGNPLLGTLPELKGTTAESVGIAGSVVLAVILIGTVNVPSMGMSMNLIDGLTPTNTPTARLTSFTRAAEGRGLATQEVAEQSIQFAAGTVTSQTVTQEEKQSIANFAVSQMEQEIARTPGDARLYQQSGVLYRTLGNFEGARTQSAKARELSPRKQSIIFEQGVEAWQAGDAAAARSFFDEAYALDTRFDDAAAYSAAGHIITGDIAGGKAILEAHFGTTQVNNTILVLAYYDQKDWTNLIAILTQRYIERGDAQSGFQLAAAYSEAGRRSEAIAQVRKVIAAHPEASAQGAALLAQLGG